MTKQERKEKAYKTVNSFIRSYKENLKYASPETIDGNKRFIEGMIAGFNYTGIITDEERVEWVKDIHKVFTNMAFEKEIEIMRKKKQAWKARLARFDTLPCIVAIKNHIRKRGILQWKEL